MTVESAVNSLISNLKSISSSTRGQATNLVTQAGAAFNGVAPPKLNPIQFEAERTTTGAVRVPKPPNVGDITPFENPEFSGLQDITPFTGRFTDDPPKINLPGPIVSSLKRLPEFNSAPPSIPTLIVNPDFSLATQEPHAPDLILPGEFRTNPLSGNPPDVPKPEFDEFGGDFFTEYQNGLKIMAPDMQSFSQWLQTLYQDVIVRLDEVFTTRIQGVLRGTETAVPDDWSTQRQTQTVQNLRSERQAALTALDEAPSSLTGLPTGQRLWARLDLELKTLQGTTQSASKVAVERRTREVKHLQWAMQLCAQWIEAALTLKAQEVGWRMKGAQLALDGASQALALAVKVLETKDKEIQFFIQYNETQSRRTELRLKLEQTKLTEIKTVLDANRLKSTFNQHQLQVYQGAMTIVEQRIKKYQTETEYLATQQKLELLKLRIYEAQVKAFDANVKAFAAEQQSLTAQVKGDVARMEGELVKVRQYQAQVKAFEAEVAGLSATVTAQAAQNNALLEEYNALLDGKLMELRSFNEVLRLAVTSMLQGFDAEEAEMSLALQGQDLEDRNTLDNALREMQKDHTETILALEEYGILFTQRQAEGAVIAQGASTVGSLSTQAFAGLNSVGALEIVESA
jgi:hypothetical protein